MRTIKFRAWDKVNNKWHVWKPFNSKLDGDIYMTMGKGDDDLEYQQYTGLKDKNGKEIYEGDIVMNNPKTYPTSCTEGPRTVVWEDKKAWFTLKKGDELSIWGMIYIGYEVIGNIYENPELLNNKS